MFISTFQFLQTLENALETEAQFYNLDSPSQFKVSYHHRTILLLSSTASSSANFVIMVALIISSNIYDNLYGHLMYKSRGFISIIINSSEAVFTLFADNHSIWDKTLWK